MLPRILAAAAVLAVSSVALASHGDDAADCSYTFDVTRAIEPAASGCPVATWHGGGYDVAHMDAIPAQDGAPTPAPEHLALLWTVP